MSILLLLLLEKFSSSEWIGNIVLHPSNLTFHNIYRANRGVFFIQFELNGDFPICRSNFCYKQISILAYNNRIDSLIKELNSSVAIVIANET